MAVTVAAAGRSLLRKKANRRPRAVISIFSNPRNLIPAKVAQPSGQRKPNLPTPPPLPTSYPKGYNSLMNTLLITCWDGSVFNCADELQGLQLILANHWHRLHN